MDAEKRPALAKDPRIPDLHAVLDHHVMASGFAAELGASSRDDIKVTKCRRLHTTYRPLNRCVAVFQLGTEKNGHTHNWMGAVTAGQQGLVYRVLPDDPDLPGLREAMDPSRMVVRLSAAQAVGLPEIFQCEVEPVSYKPGQSCVLHYRLQTPADVREAFGKLLSRGGDELFSTTSSLRAAAVESPRLVEVCEPIAYWPDLQLLAQAAVAGKKLGELLFDGSFTPSTRLELMDSVGQGLAAMHSLSNRRWMPRTLEQDVDDLRDFFPLFERLAPNLAGDFADFATSITQNAREISALDPVPSHGALRTDQLMISDGTVVAMDLDGICIANPARDLSNLLAYLDWKAMRQPENRDLIGRAEEALMAGYRVVRPAPNPRWIALFRAASLLKIAGRRLQSLALSEWPLLPKLLGAVRVSVEL